MKNCPVCQKVLTDQAKFCYYCGASLLNSPAAQAPISAEQPVEEAVEAVAEQSVAEVAEEAAEQPVEEVVEAVAEQSVAEVAEEAAEQPVEEVVEEAAEQPVEEVAEEAAEQPVIIPAVAPVEKPIEEAVEQPVAAPAAAPVEKPNEQPAPEPKAEQPVLLATDSRSLMTTAGYIFTSILFHIPVIGLIFMLVWGCGRTKNLSRKRFSLACLIVRLLGYIVLLSATVFMLICFSGKFPILTEAFAKFFS